MACVVIVVDMQGVSFVCQLSVGWWAICHFGFFGGQAAGSKRQSGWMRVSGCAPTLTNTVVGDMTLEADREQLSGLLSYLHQKT